MPDTSSVGFHPDLEVSFLGSFRNRSDAKVRAIDVSCNDRNSSAGLPPLWDGEREQGALVSIRPGVHNQDSVRWPSSSPCKEVFPAFFYIILPFVYLTDLITKKQTKMSLVWQRRDAISSNLPESCFLQS